MRELLTEEEKKERARLSRKKYRETPRGREAHQRGYAKWAASEKGKESIARKIKEQTENGTYAARARRYRERTRAWLRELKSKPCADCGGMFDPVCMDFDHRPGTVKAFGVGKSLHVKREDMLAEIAKCDLVCANCHRLRTFRQRDHRVTCKRRVS